jgi:hypothetical protein
MSEWTTIATPNKLINLLSLQNGTTTNLGATTLTTGTYRGFRLVIDPAQSSITLKDGSHPSITFPSASRTGIKINLDHDIEVVEGGTVMVLDFDVGRSFVMKGNSISQNGLNFKPVIRAVASELTGSVSGTVVADAVTGAGMANATVEVLKAGTALTDATPENIVGSASTDANGSFTIKYVLPGSYELRVTPPSSSGYQAKLVSGGVTVTSGVNTALIGIVVTK